MRGFRRVLPEQSFGSVHTYGTTRHPSLIDPILSKRVCFYKSGDPQFNGLRMVINNRTFKTFDTLLDSLSKKVPLAFGVRNITTPRGIHAVHTLDELEDGKSYICSDTRKVKPIDLAVARRKLAPWYHARPVSSRRRTVQQARFFPGRNFHKEESMLVRTPKTLLVFRNGDPTVEHSVVLHKRTTTTFESILEYISELMQFHVRRLHTADGRRVDGLPGLMLCSGTVVAVGREPFRHANYNEQKPPAETTVPPKRLGHRRRKASKRKKKSQSYTPKSRNFSLSSERYIVNRIHNSIADNSCDRPSVVLESGHILESVAETPDSCLGVGAEEQDRLLPTEDDIEKSFRVNQDGSMTVEMKVRLTIKEEETIHWTTTLARSSVANQLHVTCLPEPVSEQEISSLKSTSLDLESPAASININKDKTQDNNDEDPPSLGSGVFSGSIDEEDASKVQTNMGPPRSAPSPGHEPIRTKKASAESIQSVTVEGIQEGVVGSYAYREQTENGAVTEQYCMVKQTCSRPVPKPTRHGSVDADNMDGVNVSPFKSAGRTEIRRIESSREKVSETVLHVYEQGHFFANLCSEGVPAFGIPFGRPATSETGQLSSDTEFEPQPWRPSTASESIRIWRTESTSETCDLTSSALRTAAFQANGKSKPQQREVNKDKGVPSKPNVINKRVEKVKTISSAGFMKKSSRNKSKSAKSMMKLSKGLAQNGDRGVTTGSSRQSDDTIKCIIKDSNVPSALKETTSEIVSFEECSLSVAPNEVSQPQGILTRQTSEQQEKKKEKESYDVSESMSLPAFNSSSAVTNEYVGNWLEKARLNPSAYPNEESRNIDVLTLVQTESGRCVESDKKKGLMLVADEAKCLEDTSGVRPLKVGPLPQDELGASVKQRIRSLENKSSSRPMGRAVVNQQVFDSRTTTTNTKSDGNSAHTNTDTIKPLFCSESSTEISAGSEMEKKSSHMKILFKKETSLDSFPMDLPPPPPPVENTDIPNTGYSMTDASSVSVSSQTSDKQPLTISTKADKADHTLEMTTSIHTDTSTQSAAPLPRTPSIKRTPLVSNKSLDRKMSLRKACLDKYTSCSDAPSETSTSSAPINTVGGNVLPSGICSTGTQPPSESRREEARQSNSISDLTSRLSCCTSASPPSLTSEERMSSHSISSIEAPTPSDLPLQEIKNDETTCYSQKEALSTKPSVKNGKVMSSPSPERKSQTKKFPSELPHNSPKVSSLHKHPAGVGLRRHATPNVSPSTERKLNRPTLQKRPSPYSQSLDIASQHKSSGRLLSRNVSSDNASEPTHKTQSKTPSQRRRHQTPQSINSTDKLEKTPAGNPLMPLDAEQSDDSRMTDDLEKSRTQRTPQPLHIANRPKMKAVLEKICYSIKSIRQITQNKRLERSNSLPDFSSHVTSTFGSSSKALLAFLSVMTLKEGLADVNMNELNADGVSCVEALKMIDSLRRIASIEDSHQLKASLSNLQQSASKQLLQSWKGFQNLGDQPKSRSSTSNNSEQEVATEAGPEKDRGIDENVIDEIVDNLDIPERLKEALTSFSKDKSNRDGLEPKDNSNAKGSPFSTEDAVNVRDVSQEENDKEFTDIKQPKQSSTGRITKDTEDEDCLYEPIGGYQRPPAETSDKQTPEEPELYSTGFFAKDNRDKSNPERTKRNRSVRSKKSLEQDSGSSEVEEQDMEGHQLQIDSEESVSDNELTRDVESVSDERGQHTSSATKDLEQEVLCKLSASSSEAGEQHGSEEEPEGECEEVQQESRGGGRPPNNDSHSEEKEDEQPKSNYYSEVNGRGKESILRQDSHRKSSSEEEQPEVECQAACMGSNVSVDGSTCDSDVDDPSSEEEQEVECKTLKVIIEENVSDNEKEEEEHRHNLPDPGKETRKYRGLKTLIEEEVSSEEKVHRADETYTCDTLGGDPSHFRENQSSYTKKDESSLTYGFNADDNSGNDHSSCEEHAEMEQPTVTDKPINNSSSDDKESSSEEEHADMDTYTEESCTEYQEAPAQSQDTKCEKVVEKLKHQTGKIISQTIAERVILLEKQVADAQKTTEGSAIRRFSQRDAPREPDAEDSPSESPTSQSAPATRSAPQSSLSFSYDSSGVITSEPEGNTVRFIRDMFLAKSATDTQPRCFPSSNTFDTRTETSASGGYQSQTSSELSSSEDDSARKSITKGFVRRTIESLYGRKDAKPDEEASERPPSAPKQKKKEHSSILFPFQTSRSKAMSELSYFNSTNAADNPSEATRCVAFNARVGPEDRVSLDHEKRFLRENDVIRKSASDPVGINKTSTNVRGEATCEGTEESSPYSLLSSKSEQEDKMSLLSRKCTYFSLPHMSDSDSHQDDLNTVGKSSAGGDGPADTRSRDERNDSQPGVGVTEFKMKANKVHPLMEPPPDGEVVVVQPEKGQGVMSRRIQEPDMLDVLYNFCGQNCPIL
ncbi:oxygen-regulated protein 1-like [Pseudoliparis swirei]|uniref:oxygen-regulated protein 1-like n=1 Tax=Pseudoliparis swirei TaxID=2059687 RepID=UPI0024BEE9CD|nr:oxygen-regulated protein 1-like [Pseudoliparis swirei]